jgi:hypothetical protein
VTRGETAAVLWLAEEQSPRCSSPSGVVEHRSSTASKTFDLRETQPEMWAQYSAASSCPSNEKKRQKLNTFIHNSAA